MFDLVGIAGGGVTGAEASSVSGPWVSEYRAVHHVRTDRVHGALDLRAVSYSQ